MAQATGYTCDRAACGKFAVAGIEGKKPEGWIHVTFALPAGPQATPGKGNVLDLCSDICMALVAIERYEEFTDKRFVRTAADGRAKAYSKKYHAKRNTSDG
jgi:hypothetical protein